MVEALVDNATRRLLPGGMAALEVTTFIAEMKHSIQRALAGPLTN